LQDKYYVFYSFYRNILLRQRLNWQCFFTTDGHRNQGGTENAWRLITKPVQRPRAAAATRSALKHAPRKKASNPATKPVQPQSPNIHPASQKNLFRANVASKYNTFKAIHRHLK
jgi:hypothetical protein